MEIKGYTLVNEDKLTRTLDGLQRADGTIVGGVANGAYKTEDGWQRDGEALSSSEVDKLETAILAEYDRFGGLIKRGDDKVVTGSFYNFQAKKPHEKPQVKFVYKVNDKFVVVPDGKELPGEVKAVKALAEQEAEAEEAKEVKKVKRVKKS